MKEAQEKVKKRKKKKNHWWVWPLKAFIIALVLSFAFSIVSEMIFSVVGIIVSVVVIFILLAIGILCDMIGMAVASADIKPFTAMMSRKVRGSKESMRLIKNAEKVSSICNDIVGDICGILTGAAGAVIALKIIPENVDSIIRILIASSVSALIAGLTILGKACFKKVAIDNSTKIVLSVGKLLSIFSRKKKNKKRKAKRTSENKAEVEVKSEEVERKND